MRVSTAVVDRLAANGIDTVFGIPGTQTLPLNETIDGRDDVEFVVARHETAVSHQAWGYAESSGDPAATLVVPGPGDLNATNGLKNAYNDCTPLVHLAVETDPELRGGDDIHETPPETYDTVVKHNALVTTPESTLAVLEEAIATAETPPKGPVRVGIPRPFLTRNVALAQPGTYDRSGVTGVDDDSVAAAADLLNAASAPVVLVGGGVRAAEAGPDARAVAARLGAPVVTTYKGKGVVPDADDIVAGTLSGSASPALLDCLADADALLAVGTDFDAVATRSWSVDLPDDLVHVTLSPGDLGTGYEPTVGIAADAGETLTALAASLDEGSEATAVERATAVRESTRECVAPLAGDDLPLTSVAALGAIRDALPVETIVTADAGGFRVWALNTFAAAGPRSFVTPGSWASMGTALPAGIGAACANPDQEVVVLTGDGGLLMCLHELHTAVAAELSVTTVVFNNSDYAIISEAAGRDFDLPADAYDWADAPLDFTALAAGMGMETARAETPEGIRESLADALAADGPSLLEVPTDPDEPQATTWMAEAGE
jgi:acetolactate synthase-1/2/3 large subunit